MPRITTKDCKNIDGEKVKLTISTASDDSMIVDLVHVDYTKNLWGKIKSFIMLLMFIGLSSSLSFTNVFILSIAIILLLVNLFLIVQLVEKESISIVRKFAVQLTTTKAFGRKVTESVPCDELKSLVINEVIDNQRVIFLMQLLAKPQAGGEEPRVIPLFQYLKPNRECLEFAYKIMKSKLRL